MIKVLIIDDDATIAKYLGKFLEAKGLNVKIAGDGKTGIADFANNRPNIVILDLGLPDIIGEEVYPILRQIDAKIPIAILSGYDDKKEMMLERGADNYFIKPLLPMEVEKWILKIVNNG